MYKTKMLEFRQSYNNNTLNGDHIQPDYFYIGHDSTFVPTGLNFKFFTDSYPFNYYRNVLPYTSQGGYQNYNAFVYPSSYSQDFLALYTEPPAKLIFGYELPNNVNFAYYDTQAQKLYTTAKTTNFIPGNDGVLCTYENASVDSLAMIFLFNGIVMQYVKPYYEKLLNPFQLHFSSSYDYLEEHGTFDLCPPTYLPDGVPTSYTIYFPKYMLMIDGKYYIIDTGSFKEFTPNNTLVSLDELNQNGFTLDDYNSLTKDAWTNIIDIQEKSCIILSNGYVTPTIVLGTYWLDKYGYTRFIWGIQKKQKTLILTGQV